MYSTLKRKTPLKAKAPLGVKKERKEIPDWKREKLAHHHHTPTRADRAEFPAHVVKAAKERSGGFCEVCRMRPDTESHHCWPRSRNGRGVLSNILRVCHFCHMDIQNDEEKLQYWIEVYRQMYGDYFYFDAEDMEALERKQSAIREAEEAKKQRLEQLEPVLTLLASAAGRKLNSKEIKFMGNLDDRDMAVFARLMADIVEARLEPRVPFSYGKFDD